MDILTAFEDGTHELADPDLLDRSSALGRVLYSNDVDLLVEARRRQKTGKLFSGVIVARQSRVGIGRQIEDLEIIAKTSEPPEIENALLFLPIR